MALVENKWINKNAQYYGDIADNLLADGSTLFIDPTVPEIPAYRYQTYANAVAYINGVGGGANYFNRWVCSIKGQLTENIALEPFIYITSNARGGVLSGSVTTAGTSNDGEAYKVNDLIVGSIDVADAASILEVRNCIVAAQVNTVGAGQLYIRSSNVFKQGALTNVNYSSLSRVVLTEGTQLADTGSFSTIDIRTAAYVSFQGSPTGNILNLYDGAASVFLTDGETLTIGQMYSYNGNFNGSGFGFGTNPKVIINNTASYPSELINTVIYAVDFEISGAGGILKVKGVSRGENSSGVNPSTFTETAGGVLDFTGDTYEGPLSAKDTVGAINELAGQLTPTITKITSDHSAVVNEVVIVDGDNGAVNITLPVPSSGAKVVVKNFITDYVANVTTVLPNAAELLDGNATYVCKSDKESIEFISDGTDWFII